MIRKKHGQDPTKPCLYCHQPMKRKRFCNAWEDVTNFKKRKFCSRKCYFSWKRENFRGTSERTQTENRGAECLVSKKISGPNERSLHVHHIDGNRENNDHLNLATLCCKCHKGQHRKNPLVCSVDGCNAPAKTKTFCYRHYYRWRRYKNPLLVNRKGVLVKEL